MKKILITALAILAGVAFAQLPATMTSFGVDLPSGALRIPTANCAQMAANLDPNAETFECYLIPTQTMQLQNLTFELQTASFGVAGFRLGMETAISDDILVQFWENTQRLPDATVSAVYVFNDASLGLVFIQMPR